jgi:hypothetical protein
MKRSRVTTPVPILAGLWPSLLFATLFAASFATFAFSLDTETAPAQAGRGFAAPYDAAHEITLTGNVQEVVTKHVAGSPAGMHLLIDGPQGTVDAHLGPYLAKDTQEALHTGTPVQIVGAMESLHGRQILLARQLVFGGRIVTIRSPHGFLVRAHATRRVVSSDSEKSDRAASNGGSR